MPRTRSLAWSELKIGLLTITAIVIAAILVFSLTGAKGWFWQRYTLKSRFPTVACLAVGSPVRVAGMQVGSVKDIQFAGEQVDVVFDVNKKVQDRITDKSSAYLGSVSLLGSSAVDITPMTSGTPIPEYGYVPQGHAKGRLSDIAEEASGTIKRAWVQTAGQSSAARIDGEVAGAGKSSERVEDNDHVSTGLDKAFSLL